MKIVVSDFTGIKKAPYLETGVPLGASDRAVLELCYNLASRGHDVFFVGNTSISGKYEGVTWSPNITDDMKECDVLICQRQPRNYEQIQYKKLIYYTHDDIDAPVMKDIKNFLKIPDVIVCLSGYHAERLIEVGADKKKIRVIPEGLDFSIPRFGSQEPRGKRLIYASAPYKGLPLLMKLWPRIKEKHPDAILDVYSSMKLYQAPEKDVYFMKLYEEMEKDPTISWHAAATNLEVVRAMGDAALMVYPCFFVETFCNAANEAIYMNTPVITTYSGALPETVDSCGILIAGSPKSQEYQDAFVNAVDECLSFPNARRVLAARCANRSLMSWQDVAEAFEHIMYDILEGRE